MEIPRSYIDNFTRGINTISEGAQKALARELAALDYSDMTAAINKAVGIMESYCATTSDATARLAAQFYRGMSVLQTGEDYQAEAISGHVPVATEKATRGIAQEGVDGNIAGMIKQLAERVDYEAKRAAGETVMGNARRDRRRVRYARVPSGNETCMFCIMLASRGFVYHSAESAGELNHYHANCDCRIVPSFAAATVPGYDPAEYYRIWKSGVLPQRETAGQPNEPKPKAFEFEPAQTKKEARQYLEDLGFSYIAGSLTLEELNELGRYFGELIDRYPFMRGVVRSIRTGAMQASAYYSANWTRKTQSYEPEFKFNRRAMASAARDAEYACRPNEDGIRWWSQKEGLGGLIVHEFTHALEYKLEMARAGIVEGETVSYPDALRFSRRSSSVSSEVVSEGFRRAGIEYTPSNVKLWVSEYGSTNTLETLAEAMSCEDSGNMVCNSIKEVFAETIERSGLQ